MNTEVAPQIPRAERFARPATILYRRAGDVRWREGRTENISRSGVLFRGMEPVELQAPVEIVMDLPAEVAGAGAGMSLGRGRIVRQQPEEHDVLTAFAATINDWEKLALGPRRI
jgi:hypothetical protein